MHEDSLAFRQCADLLWNGGAARTAAQRYAKLGVGYYAWLAATSAAKNGLPTAQETALHFLAAFRPLQRELRVSDARMCTMIAGDCASRTARLLEMERALPAATTASNAP